MGFSTGPKAVIPCGGSHVSEGPLGHAHRDEGQWFMQMKMPCDVQLRNRSITIDLHRIHTGVINHQGYDQQKTKSSIMPPISLNKRQATS